MRFIVTTFLRMTRISPHFSLKLKPAFTLSEVLITLGIIGVIATIVIPTVVGKVNEHVRKTQFKRAYTLLASAVQKLEEDKGYVACSYGAGGNVVVGCKAFFKEVGEYLKPIKYCPNKALENGCIPTPSYKKGVEVYAEKKTDAAPTEYSNGCEGFNYFASHPQAYVLADGIILLQYQSYDWVGPLFIVDINGFKAPNKWGYDVFVFRLYRRSLNSGLELKPDNNFCHPVEKGGKNARDFFTSI